MILNIKLLCLSFFLGLCIGVTVLEGAYGNLVGECEAARKSIQNTIKEEGVKGFADIVVSNNVSDSICHL